MTVSSGVQDLDAVTGRIRQEQEQEQEQERPFAPLDIPYFNGEVLQLGQECLSGRGKH